MLHITLAHFHTFHSLKGAFHSEYLVHLKDRLYYSKVSDSYRLMAVKRVRADIKLIAGAEKDGGLIWILHKNFILYGY